MSTFTLSLPQKKNYVCILLYSLPLVLVETILLGKSWSSCPSSVLSEKMFCDVFFPACVYVATLNLIASIPGPSTLTYL